MASREFLVTPKVGETEFPILRRSIQSDEQGRIKPDRIVPGLTYHVQVEPPVLQRLKGGGFILGEVEFDQDVVLAPKGDE